MNELDDPVLKRYGWDARKRFRERSADFVMELHLDIQELLTSNGDTTVLPDHVDRSYRRVLRRKQVATVELTVATFFLSIGVGALFTLYSVAADARPSAGIPIAWVLVGIGFGTMAVWVRSLVAKRALLRRSTDK